MHCEPVLMSHELVPAWDFLLLVGQGKETSVCRGSEQCCLWSRRGGCCNKVYLTLSIAAAFIALKHWAR